MQPYNSASNEYDNIVYSGQNSWTTEESDYILQMYNENIKNIGPDKVFRCSNEMWDDVAMRINIAFNRNRTKEQCIALYNELQNNNIEVNERKRKRVDTVLKLHEDSNEEIDALIEEVEKPNSPIEGIHILAQTVRRTLLEITEINERNQERRHKELMTMLEKYLKKENATENKSTPSLNIASGIVDHSLLKDSSLPVETLADELDCYKVEQILDEQHNFDHELLSISIQTPKTKRQRQQQEFHIMRRKMLEIQRKKMEDREQKNRQTLRRQLNLKNTYNNK